MVSLIMERRKTPGTVCPLVRKKGHVLYLPDSIPQPQVATNKANNILLDGLVKLTYPGSTPIPS